MKFTYKWSELYELLKKAVISILSGFYGLIRELFSQ